MCAVVSTVSAEPVAVKDPMKPPGSSAIQSKKQSGEKGWVVAQILISPERRLAVINGKLVKVGSVVNGARVNAIYGNAVELNINGKAVLFAPVKRDIKRQSK